MSTSLSKKLNAQFNAAVIRFLMTQGVIDVVEVLSWYEDHYTEGYCETCAYDEWTVDITYRTAAGDRKTYTYDGRFSDLLNKLLNA